MGWGWPFSSSPSPPSSNPTEARATPPPPPSAPSNAEIQQYQLALMRLEIENRELLLKAREKQLAEYQAPLHQAIQRSEPTPKPEPVRAPEAPWRRSAKQLGLFFAGATFLTASALISRRAVNRKMVASYPKLFQPSHHGPKPPPRAPQEKSDDQFVAVEALGLATLNVMSFGVMLTGGLMYAFDISNVDELRTKARSSLYGPNGVVDEAAEQQMEDWIVDMFVKREETKRQEEEAQEGQESDPKKDA